MFCKAGITGLAVILGRVSGGLACRDFDLAASYHQWADNNSNLAKALPTVQTVRGFHLYFQGPEGFQTLSDGEYRGDSGHYCLLPPSRHPTGQDYRWIVPLPDGDLPEVDPLDTGLVPPIAQATQATQATQDTHCMCPPMTMTVDAAISATLPTGPGQRNRLLFQLARYLRAIIPAASVEELREIVRQWHTRALPFITTKDFSTTWEDFRIAWMKVKWPVGAWGGIVQKAKARSTGKDAYAKLFDLCAELQEHHGASNPWPLSCRKAGMVIGVPLQRAAELLLLLQFDKVIELVTPGGPKGSRRAAEYRVVVRRRK